MADALPSDSPELEADEPVKYWLQQIEAQQKARENWYKRCEKINKRYSAGKEENELDKREHTMNVLWSNVETIKPALYAKTPSASIQRRFRDKDQVGKWAATVLERCIDFSLDAYDCDYEIRNCTQDYLLGGIGQVWISYEPQIVGEQIAWEMTRKKHLHYRDFLSGPARTWGEVPWVAQRAFMGKAEVKKRFPGKEKQLSFQDQQNETKSEDKDTTQYKAAIWEIWNKADRKVYFVSKNCKEFLQEPEAPGLSLENFFPCPRPLVATCTTNNLIPTPDFILYQNQADEIDELTARINILTKALRVVGVYDATNHALSNVLDSSSRSNEMIPVENWAVFGQSGGFKGAVDFFPIDMIIKALTECYAAREQAKSVMYEITGISDIVRGSSDPNETATAQQIKTQWGGLRIRDRQKEVQRFVRDIIRIESEIIAEQYQPDTIKTMSNAPLITQAEKMQLQQRQAQIAQMQQAAQANPAMAQQMPQIPPLTLDEMQQLKDPSWEDVLGLLKDQKLRSFRIDIETDSTIAGDEAEEKQARTEFVTALTSLIEAWGPIVMQAPKLAPLFGEILLFATRAFKAAEGLETAIEEAVETFSQQAMAPQQQKPDPEMAKVQGEQQIAQARLQGDQQLQAQKIQGHQQLGQQKLSADVQLKQQQMAVNAHQEASGKQLDVVMAGQQAKESKAENIQPQIDALQKQMQNGFLALATLLQGMQKGERLQ